MGMRETSSRLTNFLNQKCVICHHNVIVSPLSPVKLNFVGHICSGIDMDLVKIFNSNIVGLFFQVAYPNSQITGKIQV